MQSLELTGTIVDIQPVQQVTDKFKKREFVIETKEEINGSVHTNYAKMQCVQAKCDLLNRFSIGEEVTASFNIKGNRWEKDGKVQFITNLDCWKMQSTGNNKPAPAPQYQQNVNNNAPVGQQYNAPAGAPPAPVWNGYAWVLPTPAPQDNLPF